MTHKITKVVANIVRGRTSELCLGNLDAKHDRCLASDYVEATRLMLQHNRPDHLVITTGEAHSVREFCEVDFGYVGLDDEQCVVSNPKLFRPAEVGPLLGDPTKAIGEVSWTRKTSFERLVTMMLDADRAAG